jgi:ankyrin repeat protein
MAARKGSEDVITLLITNGAGIRSQLLLTQVIDPDVAISYNNPLSIAVESNHTEAVGALLDGGADVDAIVGLCNPKNEDYGKRVIHIAAAKGFASMLDLLLSSGANSNAKNMTGHAAIHIAAQNSHTNCIEVLARHKADLNAVNHFGETALHISALGGDVPSVKALVRNGADKEAVNRSKYSQTALHFAAAKGNAEMVACLLELGCNPNAKKATNTGGSTAIQMAAIKGYNEVVSIFKKYGSQLETQRQKTTGGSSSLMYFLDEVPDEFKPKIENLKKVQEAFAKAQQFMVQKKLTKQEHVKYDGGSQVEEPWKTVRLFLSSTFAGIQLSRDVLTYFRYAF